MIIQPGFPDHWKVRELNRLSASKEAAYWLLRLWGRVQERKSQQFSDEPAEIAATCGYEGGEPERFCEWLLKLRILEQNGSGYWVRGWEEYNGSLIANWKNGQKGGRPAKPMENPLKTHGLTQTRNGLTDRGIEGWKEEERKKSREERGTGEGTNEFCLSADAGSNHAVPKKKRAGPIMMSNALIKELAGNPAYKEVDVVKEAWKFKTWCETKQKPQTKARFVNWLNRVA